MQSKLFGNRLVLDVGVSQHIFDMNESNGIANSKGFGVLRGFERFGKSCCLKGQHRQGAVFAANNAYLRNVVAYTFFLPVEYNNVIIDHLLEQVVAVCFPHPKSDLLDINAVDGSPYTSGRRSVLVPLFNALLVNYHTFFCISG